MPVKFAPPPFVSTNAIGLTISDFEPPVAMRAYVAPTNVDGWNVTAGQVSVTNSPVANTGSQSLMLQSGQISRTLPTIAGHNYNLRFAYREVPVLDGLVSWWQAEGTANDRLDVNNGALVGGAGFAQGEVGRAFSLDGVSQYVSVPDSTSLHQASFTVEGWFNFAAMGSVQTLFAKPYGNGTSNSLVAVFDGARTLTVGYYTAGGNGMPVTDIEFTPAANTWHHVACTFDGLTMTLYVDAAYAGSQNSLSPIAYDNHPFLMGADMNNGAGVNFFNGLIDEVALFNRALSPAEIAGIVAAGPLGKCGMSTPPTVCVGGDAKVMLDGTLIDTFSPTNMWLTNFIAFTASTNGTLLSLAPALTGGASSAMLDSFTLNDSGSPYYVLPEEPMSKLTAENAQGAWTLEILDDRVGATNPTPTLLHWQLGLVFQDNFALPVPLQHGETVTNLLLPGQIQYFTVAVPDWAKYATNLLRSATAPLNLLFNQQKAPTGTNEGDFLLLANATNGAAVLWDVGAPSTPPLVPDATYYLGVQNLGSNSLTFALQVDFDVTPLTLNVPLVGTNATSQPRYFSYLVTPNETAVSFALTNLSGNVDLVASFGMPFPTTDPGGYDYGSFNPAAVPEQIIVFTNSTPVALAPGEWYLGVINNDTVPVTYTIVVTDYTNALPNIITLTNGIPYANTNSGVSGSAADYYMYIVEPGAKRGQFEINNASDALTLVARYGFPLPNLLTNDYSALASATNDALITVYDYSSVPLTPGAWFLSAVNGTGSQVTYSIKASDWAAYGTPITIRNVTVVTNQLSFIWNGLNGVHYFVEGRTNLMQTNWTTLPPPVTATGPWPGWSMTLPTNFYFFRVGDRH